MKDGLTYSSDFNPKAIEEVLNKYSNLSITEKDTAPFWKEVAKEVKKLMEPFWIIPPILLDSNQNITFELLASQLKWS